MVASTSSSSLGASVENYSSAVDSVLEERKPFSPPKLSRRQSSSLEDYIETSLMLQCYC